MSNYEFMGRRFADIKNAKMKIDIAFPPNFAEIVKVFPMAKDAATRGIYFCYGNTIYNPAGRSMPIELIAHEATHAIQQEATGITQWWEQYLHDTEFRFYQELEAHRVEYEKYIKDHPGRHFRRGYQQSVAERLSGPLYNHCVPKDRAMRLISQVDRAIKEETNGS